jgi:thiol:disulfide interchange protein
VDEETGKPFWRTTLFRYLLGPVLSFILMIVAVVAFSGVQPRQFRRGSDVYQTAPEGSNWKPYSGRMFRLFRDDQRTILIHFVAGYSQLSQKNRVILSIDPRVRSAFDRTKTALLLANVSSPSAEVSAALNQAGDEAELPMIAIYRPEEEVPTILTGPIDVDRLIAELTSP